MTGGRGDEQHPEEDAATPWHHSTAKVLGASIGGLAAIGLVLGGVMFVSRQADETPQAPQNFVEPSFSRTTDTSSTAPSTTSADNRPNNPQTTDIDLPPTSTPPPPPPPPPPSSEDSTRRGSSTTSNNDDGDDDVSTPSSTRKRPRLNQTRTPSN